MVYCVASGDTMNVCLTASNVRDDSNDAIVDADRQPFAYIHVDPNRPERSNNSMASSPVAFHFASKSFRPARGAGDDGCNGNRNGNCTVDSVIR